jgi:hypothetical protein
LSSDYPKPILFTFVPFSGLSKTSNSLKERNGPKGNMGPFLLLGKFTGTFGSMSKIFTEYHSRGDPRLIERSQNRE